MNKDEKTGRFTQENDSVRVTYSFYGSHAPVAIEIFNKLDKPLYIDWKRSALIIGDNAVPYSGNDVAIKGSINAATFRSGSVGVTSGSIDAVASLPNNITFIPPHTKVNNTPINLPNNVFNNFQEVNLKTEQVPDLLAVDGRMINIKTASFTRENSPLKFKSYLTIYMGEGNATHTIILQHDFYVAKYARTSLEPNFIPEFQGPRGDCFYISKASE